jgi:hypothetical protein
MKTPDRAVRWIAGIVPPHPRRIGFHGANLLLHLLRRLAKANGVAVALRHLLAVKAGHLGRFRKQRVGLGEDQLATAFEVPKKPFAITNGEILLFR